MNTPTQPSPALTGLHVKTLLDQCIHCGLCLPACPTYAVYHTEMAGPRGRISLINAAAEGRIDVDGAFREHVELCLGCRACETACPSGVQYGQLFETARHAIEEKRVTTGQRSRVERFVRWLALRQLLLHPRRLRPLARVLRFYQKTNFSSNLAKLSFLPAQIRMMAALLPRLSANFPNYRRPAPAIGEQRGTLAFLHGCVQDVFLSDVNAATVRVLQQNGYEVHFPQTQSCCGAAPLHIGEAAVAREMAKRNIDAFAGREYDAIINNAGGCGATLKQYDHLLADDPAYAAKASEFTTKVRDISEFLATNLHKFPVNPLEQRVTYIDSCHLRHWQKVVQQPRDLLNAIPGLDLIEVQQPDMCCGSAGVYNILQAETANQVLDAKMVDVKSTGAQTIVTSNTGCQMQMIYGARKHGLDVEVVHVVQLLARAYD